MKYQDFTQHFSKTRINRYLYAVGKSKRKAIKLYKANLFVAQAFHPLLGILEVVLRNRMNDILSSHFVDDNWIINQKIGFMSDSSLTYTHKRTGKSITNNYLKKEIEKAEKRLFRMRVSATSSRIIAEQTLGFWTDLFEVHHYKLLKGQPIKIFTQLPKSYGRKEICDELAKIRFFRNRINHNEPICFSGNSVDFSETIHVYNSIIAVLTWIDPQLVVFCKELDQVLKSIEKANKI